VKGLHPVLQGGRQLARRAAELFKQILPKLRIRRAYVNGPEQFFSVQKHDSSPSFNFDLVEKGMAEKAYKQLSRNETPFNVAVIRRP
jgi:hypothetical protein